jgi:tetratricopeptide (TPR) repeat protein
MSKVAVKSLWLLRRAEILEKSGNRPAAMADRQMALDEADQALALKSNAMQLGIRAEILLAMGRPADARRDLLAALQKSPRYLKASELLAKVECGLDSKRNGIP